MTWRRLSHVAEVSVSTVDKHTVEGEVPVRLCNYVDVYKNDVIVDELDFMSATATPDEIRRFSIAPGDTLFTKDSETADDIGVPAYVRTRAPLVCGYHVAIARPREAVVHPRYLYWSLASSAAAQQWRVLATGVTRVGLRHSDIGKLSIWMPDLRQQAVIADFLDREMAKIDALIAKQQQLAAILLEHRSAIVSTTFSRLVQANTPGVPLKHHADVQTGVTLGSVASSDVVTVPYLRVANVQTGFVDLTQVKEVTIAAKDVRRHLLQPGDVLMTEGGDIDKLGRGCVWQGEIEGCIHQNHIFAVRCRGTLFNRYLVYVMESDIGRRHFRRTAKKTTNLASTNSTNVANFVLPIPSFRDQERIVARLDQQTAQVERLVTKATALMAVMRERRAALITAAVTGKLDVSTYGKAG